MTTYPVDTSPSAPRDPSKVEGIALSNEELFVILRLLRTRAIPGFDTTWAYTVDGTLTERGRECVAPTIRALIARGYLQVKETPATAAGGGGEPDAVVSAPVIALVGVCARSATTVRVLSHAPDLLGEFFLHVWEGLGAYHSSTGDGIHTFVPLDGRAGVIQATMALAGFIQGAPPSVAATAWRPAALAKDALEKAALAAAHCDTAGVHSMLAATPLAPDMRAELARALLAPGRLSEITVATRAADDSVAEHTVFCVVAPGSVWSFAAERPADVMRLLGPNGETGIRQWLDSVLPR